MNQIAIFDRHNLTDVRAAVEAKFNELKDEIGLSFKIGSISFEPGTFTTRMTCSIPGAESKEEKAYTSVRESLGLPPLHTTLRDNGYDYELIGFNSRAKKNPIKIKRIKDEKIYSASIDHIIRCLAF